MSPSAPSRLQVHAGRHAALPAVEDAAVHRCAVGRERIERFGAAGEGRLLGQPEEEPWSEALWKRRSCMEKETSDGFL